MKNIDENALYRNVSSKICGTLDFLKAVKDVNLYLTQFFPHQHITIFLIPDSYDTIELVASSIREINLDTPIHIPLTVDSQEAAKRGIFGSHDPEDIVRVNNRGAFKSTHEDTIAKLFAQEGNIINPIVIGKQDASNEQSILILKLFISDKTVGYLSLNASGFDQFKSHHIQMIKKLAEPFAIALNNYISYRDVVRLKNLLDDTQQVMQKNLLRISGDRVVGAEGGLQEVMGLVKVVAEMNNPVMILGETGVGKEVVANAIHQMSDRRDGPMISVNCGAIPETLIDSDLFGHEKGAFTGATFLKRGHFERAHNGTIFLDEVGELSPASQVKLLRVVQNMTFERVGGTVPIRINTRIITATHRDLPEMIKNETFRSDLWYRLSVFPICIPPLRERKQDIPRLVEYLIERKSSEMNLTPYPVISDESLRALEQYDWPGNVRELQNLIERALIISRNQPRMFNQVITATLPEMMIQFSDSPKPKKVSDTDNDEIPALNKSIKMAIEKALRKTHGCIEGPYGAATLLDLPPSTLKNKMKKLGISRKDMIPKHR